MLAESLNQSQQRVDQTSPLRADTGIGWQRRDGKVAGVNSARVEVLGLGGMVVECGYMILRMS